MSLTDLIIEVLKHKIPVTGVELMPNGSIGYKVSGFSKSDTVMLYEDHDEIHCLQRYGRNDTICDFDGLACIAFWWNENYCSYDYGWDYSWLPTFIEKGWIKEKTVTTYEVTK